jgi:protocatechuate 3,4-dioxygenase alpha subunit
VSPRGRYDLYRGQTPSQTLGPYFHQGLLRTRHAFQIPGLCNDERDFAHADLAPSGVVGERIVVEGRIIDGLGDGVVDGMIEIWQADALGRYRHPLNEGAPGTASDGFTGFGRCATGEGGRYAFTSIKPGRVPGPGGREQAPHLNLIVGARGMARHAFSRLYFEGDAGLEEDPVLGRVAARRRGTLIASLEGEADGMRRYRFDVRLQGEDETVFFDV